MTPVKVSESEDECCPKYICVKGTTPSPTCDEPLMPECGYGQELKITTSISGCREYICVCVPLEKCEPLIGPVTLEAELDGDRYDPGMTFEVDQSGCCPKMIPKCDKSLCSPPPKCPVHHTVVELPTEESKCCPDYSCSPPGEVCMYKSEFASEEELEAGTAWPIVSFKKLGEKWHDGPCKECTCVEEEEEDYRKGTKTWGGKVKGGGHLNKVFRASCETVRCPSAEENPDSKDYVLKEVPVKGVCCPEIVRTACQDEGKIYQVGKEWSQPGEHCISHQCVLSTNASLVIKQFKIRQCEKECDEGWEYQEPPPGSEKCCGQCKQVACMFGGKLHPIGSSWLSSDKCTTYYCREVDGIVQTQSIDVNCPREDRLYEDFKVEVLPIEGSCCNRTYKVACLIGEHELKEGETFVVSKCKKVFCALGDDEELSKQEVIETCNKDCQKGWEYIEPVLDSEKCCGECKQVACITEDNKLIPPGTKWTTDDGCTSHICEQKGEQLQITSFEEKCPSVDDCPPENIIFDKCCKRCNATEKCPPQGICAPVDVDPDLTKGVVDENKDFHGRCLNPDPVPGFKECKGNCHSSTFFDLRTLTHQSNCKCCQATTTKSITVKVVCEDGYYYERKVTTPTGCACNNCESPENIKSHIKSGTKTGYKPLILKDADA
ncbi:hypothetical protein J437_LFUL000776 [Ladona fulva]|uniref:CTCK domain-containing protein n=1 Tax=Ladona fulva TaxID=123851 RepID=A0A8K0PBK9_LADFU|nr:hypothetical protein J437_LFUL000776 [Ladona fulva]